YVARNKNSGSRRPAVQLWRRCSWRWTTAPGPSRTAVRSRCRSLPDVARPQLVILRIAKRLVETHTNRQEAELLRQRGADLTPTTDVRPIAVIIDEVIAATAGRALSLPVPVVLELLLLVLLDMDPTQHRCAAVLVTGKDVGVDAAGVVIVLVIIVDAQALDH